jgi:hypothetical protein
MSAPVTGKLCELTKEGFMNYKNLLFVTYFLSTGVLAAGNYASVELTHLNPTNAKSTWLREKQFMPRYPVELAMKGITGCGIFKVIVDESGSTESIDLISSVPKKVISKPVTKVIKDWSWTLADGKSPIREEKLLRLDFCMEGVQRKNLFQNVSNRQQWRANNVHTKKSYRPQRQARIQKIG